jgi:hypothetical protein
MEKTLLNNETDLQNYLRTQKRRFRKNIQKLVTIYPCIFLKIDKLDVNGDVYFDFEVITLNDFYPF